MAYPAKSTVDILDWPGLKDTDPRDLEPGEAEIQVNCCSLVLGVLSVREGYRAVNFEND